MYSGPGSGPLLAAAAAWDALAAQLTVTAAGHGSVVTELANDWRGPSALSMDQAAAPYVAWLHSTAAAAEHAAAQAKAAAAAYELAFAMTVPPPVVTANRSLLIALVATNFFGQNSAAIAATEAHYAEMWLQDATAMYGYAASAVAATRLSPFTEPPRTTNPAGPTAQSAAVAHDIANSVAAQSSIAGQLGTTSTGAQPLAASTTAANTLSLSPLITTGMSATKVVNTVMSTTSSAVSGRGILIANERLTAGGVSGEEEDGLLGLLLTAASTQHPATVAPMVSAELGRAALAGKLSVPAGWITAAPQIQPTALALPISEAIPVPASSELSPASGTVFSQSVLGTLSRDGPNRSRPKSKPIIVRSPAAG